MPEIARKLNALLEQHKPLTEESQAVYLMVELRKCMDQLSGGGRDLRLLRFYCDWTVHHKKDQGLKHIASIMETLYTRVKSEIEGSNGAAGSAPDFIYFTALRREMSRFLTSLHVDPDLVAKDELWICYAKLMVSVLADQPILKPTPSISLFAFERAADQSVRGKIELARPIIAADKKVHRSYTFNAPY